MDEKKQRMILFRIVVNQENGGFSHASNFITKLVNREAITPEDVRGVSSKLFYKREKSDLYMKSFIAGTDFLNIGKPDMLFEGIKDTICEFGLVVHDDYLQDVISIQPFVLMKMYFQNQHIFAVVLGNRKHYFSMSYFLSDAMKRKEFRRSIYYYQKDTKVSFWIRENDSKYNIAAFYPLQIVDKHMLDFLRDKLETFWKCREILFCIFGGDNVTWEEIPQEFRGILKAMPQVELRDRNEREQAVSLLAEGSTLSFLIFVFSLRSTGEKSGKTVLNNYQHFSNYYGMVVDYAAGLLQLIENIVFHAASHSGVFSIRLHPPKRGDYLQKKFPEAPEASCLEIAVADYQGSNNCDNIATNFISNMEEEEQKLFKGLSPHDLFEFDRERKSVNSEVQVAFRKYYEKLDNIGKHYGLKLFRNMIVNNRGAFHFYSCRGHLPQENEQGGIHAEDKTGAFEVFPGTGYSILLPIIPHRGNNYVIGVDNQNEFEEFCSHIDSYHCIGGAAYVFPNSYERQEKKEEVIDQCVSFLDANFSNLQKDKHNIIYINAGVYHESQAELLYKALIKQALRGKMPDVVFFYCAKDFVEGFRKSANTFFEKIGFEDIFSGNPFCIALYDKENVEETLIYPGNLKNTYRANLLTAYAREKGWLKSWEKTRKFAIKESRYPRIPYDILIRPGRSEKSDTIFECYVKKVLDKDIQGKEYGCRIKDIHMRLGSTIHISTFYEAELLFSNRYFVNRFAVAVAMDIYEMFGKWTEEMEKDFRLTICAYGMYSELLVFRIIEILGFFYGRVEADEDRIDYAILEREPMDGNWQHIDRFRYNRAFGSEEERKAHFSNRKMISIVPINSTLKTQDKLLEIFCRENDVTTEKFVRNFSLILVGDEKDNQYWKLDERKKICIPAEKKTMVSPNPCYFVQIPITYHEANKCPLCYPRNPLAEKPLVEVNSYSTVPNQSIGLWKEPEKSLEMEEYFSIFKENEEKLRKLYHSLIYSHIHRNGNHFLYYIRTEKLFLKEKQNIREWLKEKSGLIEQRGSWSVNTYHILFCPAHCSNTGFLEYVNKYVFHDAAMVVRLDVNKEYRSNLRTKYSNLNLLIDDLGKNSEMNYTLRAHFIDDSIITGKTVRRMQSLANSVLSGCEKYKNIESVIFEHIFVLVDRNSGQSRQQYLCDIEGERNDDERLKRRYFSYIDLNISSIRNHGDSCSICQLERESDGLAQISSTRFMMKYWKDRKARFEPKNVEVYDEEQQCKAGEESKRREQAKEKNYRRMYCSHMAGTLLNEQYHGNQEKWARILVLKLLLQDLKYREGDEKEQFEYFLSYLKILSRPFPVYQKSIREAIFPLLLILTQWQLEFGDKSEIPKMAAIAGKIWRGEGRAELLHLLEDIEGRVVPLLNTRERRRDLLLVCMKQLMEMKSNYFLRRENMKRLTTYIKNWEIDRELVYQSYLRYVKKLTGVNSDTNKSIWLAEEMKGIKRKNLEQYLPVDILKQIILENNRAYYDGIERLSRELKVQKSADVRQRIQSLRYQDFQRYIENNKDISIETIWNNIRFIRYLRDEFSKTAYREENTRKKYYDIAEMACDILGAEKVYVLMSTPLECERWRYELKRELGEIHEQLELEEGLKVQAEDEKKEYLVVSISGGDENVLEVPISVITNVERFEAQGIGNEMNERKKYFIWKLGVDEEHPIIIYAGFKGKIGNNLLNICARLMIMNNMLNETAFSSSALHYLYDIVTAESNAIKLSYYKSFSHTPEDIRKQQYSDVIRENKEEYLQSHVITLLSDLRISENYRAGLKRDYYSGSLKVRYEKLFGEKSILCRIKDFYVVDGMTQEHIRINVCRERLASNNGKLVMENDILIPEEQEIAYKGYANGMDELLLLIMALIENAASKGKAEEGGKEGENFVRVYLSKTDTGNLRIMNEVNEVGDLEKINFFITRPPQPKDGISIWSVSRYLLSLKCSVINKKMTQLRQGLEDKEENVSQERKNVVDLYRETKKLLEELPEIKADYIRNGTTGKIYFSIELPVLAEHYKEM